MILEAMQAEHDRQRREGAASYAALAWEDGTPSHWLQLAAECGATLPELRTLRETRRAARSTDPVTVVAAVVRAASGRHGWASSTRDAVVTAAVGNPACPVPVRRFAVQWWQTTPAPPPPTGAPVAVMLRGSTAVHAGRRDPRARNVVTVACTGRRAHWAALWSGDDAAAALAGPNACRRCCRKN
jgi:hypothetical protein